MGADRDCLFLKACRREKTARTPVWFLRQAGRYLPKYRRIRQKTTFLDFCKNAELSAEITVYAQQTLGADAAIIFSDLLLPLEPLGFELKYPKAVGPRVLSSFRLTERRVASMSSERAVCELDAVYRALRWVRGALDSRTALIGFAGAPFTLASYLIEQGSTRDFSKTKAFFSRDPRIWKVLCEKLADVAAAHLNAQVEAGADAVQIFDTWAGVLGADEYKEFAMPFSQRLIRQIRPGIPVIHFARSVGHFLERFAEAGGDVIGIDHELALDSAWRRVGAKAVQGNLDPGLLKGSLADVREGVRRILAQVSGRPGHIFNLGHGIPPDAKLSNVRAVVDCVRTHSSVKGFDERQKSRSSLGLRRPSRSSRG